MIHQRSTFLASQEKFISLGGLDGNVLMCFDIESLKVFHCNGPKSRRRDDREADIKRRERAFPPKGHTRARPWTDHGHIIRDSRKARRG